MSRLFVCTYLDEDLSVLVATLLRARGWVAKTTLEAGNLGKSDDAQLAYAAAERMSIPTHNRVDFERLGQQYLNAGRHHSGIIISVRRSPYEIAKRLLLLLNAVTADEMDDQVLYI